MLKDLNVTKNVEEGIEGKQFIRYASDPLPR